MHESRKRRGPAPVGLEMFRRPGKVTQLLLLYELSVRPQGRLQPVAKTLGVSVQAVSYLQRELARRGWLEFSGGTYHPTVEGIAALHESIGALQDDLSQRSQHLRMVRRCRAVASEALEEGDPVVLALEGGLLYARRARQGASRGRVTQGGRRGDLVEVEDLEGILRMVPAPVLCWVIPESPEAGRRVRPEVRAALRSERPGILAAEGVEAHHLLTALGRRDVLRFGVAAALREASQLGVRSVVLVTPDRAPTLLRKLSDPVPAAPVQVRTFGT